MQIFLTMILFLVAATVGCDQTNPAGGDPEPISRDGADHGLWCKEHGLPESFCTKCHPELTAKYKEAGDWCAEHSYPESACPICNPMNPPEGIAMPGEQAAEQAAAQAGDQPDEEDHDSVETPPFEEGTLIRLKSADHEKNTGIETVAVERTPVGLGVRAPARIEFDRNAVADVRASFPGIVREVLVDLGEPVEKGDKLFVLESPEIGDIQSRIRSSQQMVATARSNLERQRRLQEQGIASRRKVELAEQRLEEAEASLASSRSSLRLAGAGSAGSSGRFTIRAPIAGTVVRRPAVVGTAADDGASLATIADASAMWALVDVSERDAGLVELGQPVTLLIDGPPARKYRGEVLWVSPEVDERTRTVKVRAEVKNPDGKLRANQFVDAEIGIAPDRNSVVVPRDAVQRFDDTAVLFVRKSEGVYEPRVVKIMRTSGELAQLSGEVKPGEQVVTTGAFLLRTELQRDSIGAGCCEVPED